MQAIIVGLIIPCAYIAIILMYRHSLLNERLRAIDMLKVEWIKEGNVTNAQIAAFMEFSKNEWRKECTFWYATKHLFSQSFPLF